MSTSRDDVLHPLQLKENIEWQSSLCSKKPIGKSMIKYKSMNVLIVKEVVCLPLYSVRQSQKAAEQRWIKTREF